MIRRLVAVCIPAAQTAIEDPVPVTMRFDLDRLHQSSTTSLAITWVCIYMLAPQTPWAVICVAVSCYFFIAVFTDKVLDPSLKAARQQYHPFTLGVFRVLFVNAHKYMSVLIER